MNKYRTESYEFSKIKLINVSKLHSDTTPEYRYGGWFNCHCEYIILLRPPSWK